MGFWSSLASFFRPAVTPAPPPASTVFGYRWVAGQGVPNALTVYDFAAGAGAGIYVVIRPDLLDPNIDVFERDFAGPGPVFVVPNAPSQAMTNIIAQLRANPPAGQAALFNGVTNARLADLTGFLSYAATCLDIINHTAAGTQLMNTINGVATSVFILPGMRGNQTFPRGNYLDTLADALSRYRDPQPMPAAAVTAMVNRQYQAVQGTLAKFNQFAADLNALPLYSLFIAEGAFQASFLRNNFNFRGRQITGQNLMNWLSTGGFAAFDYNVRNFAGTYQNVTVREFFLLAIDIVLRDVAPPGTPAGANIMFDTRNVDDNVLGSQDFRPPAIGLAHELMHAMHYGLGTGPGRDLGHFTTTAAELMFAGIGPFGAVAVSENAVRGQWATIPVNAIDATNVWVWARRTVYEPPPAQQTPATMRARMRCI
jgi:hypothetical protein